MWASVIVALAGLWVMAAPGILGYGRPAATNDWVVGPVLATLGWLGASQLLRPAVRAAAAPAVWLLVAPWLLDYPTAGVWSSLIVAVLVLVLAAVAPRMDPAHFGGGWSTLWNSPLRRRYYDGLEEPSAERPAPRG